MNTDSGKANLLKSSMNDRMHELRLDMGGAELTGGGPSSGGSSTAFMQAFFDEVAEVKRRMSTIRHNMGTIEEYHGECLTAISSEQGKEATSRLDRLMVETNQIAQQVRGQLKKLDAENREFAARNRGSSEGRIRSNVHGALTRKFVELMGEYQEMQTRYKGKCKERVERQYRIVKPDVSQEELDAACDADGPAPEIFTQQILHGPGHAPARNALADIQERHKEMLKLEASIQELHQLFLDMSVLVESQGELLDQIEYTVAQSVNYTGKAVEELRSATRYQKKARKKMCCIVIVIVIIGVIILGSVFGVKAL